MRTSASKTLLFISHEASRTGAPLMLLNFVRWFRQHAGVPFVVLLKRDGPLRAAFEELGPTHVFYRPDSLRARLSGKLARLRGQAMPWPGDPRALRRIRQIGPIGLIYSNTVLNGDVLDVLREWGCPVLTHAHELETVIRDWPLPGCAEGTWACTNRYVAVSSPVLENLVERHAVPRDRIELVPEAFAPVTAGARCAPDLLAGLDLPHGRRVVAGSGTISERKGSDLFVAVAQRVVRQLGAAAPVFLWVGGGRRAGDLESARRDLAERGLASAVRMVGPTNQPYAYLGAADVFLMTSREDPFPIVCLEAGALGKPVICFAGAGGAPELVREDGGLVVPHLDVEAMADAVLRLLEDEPLRTRLGKTLQERVLREHMIEAIGPRLLQAMARCAPDFAELQRWR
jgi:glycosyltransferase involved in cell wall biosynthesis